MTFAATLFHAELRAAVAEAQSAERFGPPASTRPPERPLSAARRAEPVRLCPGARRPLLEIVR